MKYKIYKIHKEKILTPSIQFSGSNDIIPRFSLEEIEIKGIVSEHDTFEDALLEVEKIKKRLFNLKLTIIPIIQL